MRVEQFSEELLKPVSKLLRQNLEFDIMPDFLLKEKTFSDPDFNPETTLVLLDDNGSSPAAFIQGVIKDRGAEKTGYIKLLCVDSNERRKGYAAQLYKLVESCFKDEGIKRIRVYESYPNYFMPGVDPFYTEAVCFFERMGFKKVGDTSNLTADLLAQNFTTAEEEKKLQEENIICSRAAEEDKESVFNWIEEKFPAWKGEVTEAFNNKPVTMFICKMNGEIKAFSAHETNNKGTGWFGPMGTDDSLRGKGIGSILLKKCLNDMKEMGFVKAIIPWVGPIPFYAHYANARVHRVFWRYEKIL
jgi:mycothiol synthase